MLPGAHIKASERNFHPGITTSTSQGLFQMFDRLHDDASLLGGVGGVVGQRRAHQSEDTMRLMIGRVCGQCGFAFCHRLCGAAFTRKQSGQLGTDVRRRRHQFDGGPICRNRAGHIAPAFQGAPLQEQKIGFARGRSGWGGRSLNLGRDHPHHDASAPIVPHHCPIAPLPQSP